MKKSRTLSIILALALLLSFLSIPVSAATAEDALETLGIITGSGSGVTGEYLAETATRTQAALVNLRLAGLEEDAFAFEGGETFTDAADATAYWQPVLEYLKANPMLGWVGYPDGSFKPNEPITGQGFTKVLLAALGYEYGLHFDWETTMVFASSLGMTALIDKAEENLTMGDLADAVFEALGTKTDDDRDLTLISKLVADGVITEDAAVLAGFEVEEPTLAIVNAYPSAVDEITVLMNMDIPEDVSITLKRGDIGIVYDATITKDTAVLTGLYKFLPGTYTVTVGDESASFAIESQTAADLAIEADTIYDSGTQDLKVKLADQYGDAMSLAGANISVFNQTTGYVFAADSADKTVKIAIGTIGKTTTMNAKAGDVIYVFVFDPASGLTATKEVLVMEAPYIAWLEIGDVTLGKLNDSTPSRLYEGTTGNKLDVTAYDQYNQVYTLTAADIGTGTANKIQVLSSNEGVINSAMSVDKGDLVFDAEAAGSAVITLIIPNQGFIASSEPITAYATPSLKNVEIAGPAEAVYAGETAKFEIAGYDQYGNPIDVAKDTEDVTFTTTVDLDEAIGIGATNQVDFQAQNDGSTTVYYFCKGVFQGTFTVVVNPEAYPFRITGVTIPGALQTGVSVDLLSEDITVIDQYGREMDDAFSTYDGSDYDFVATSKTDEKHVELLSGSGYTFATAGLAAGSDRFTLVLTKTTGTMTVEQTESAFVFEMANIAAADIDGFAIVEAAGTMYTGTTFLYGQEAEDYHKTVIITGTTGDLAVRLLDADTDGMPDIIDVVTSSNSAVGVVSGSTLISVDESDATATIRAWRNGAAVAMTDIDLSDKEPELASIKVADNDTADINWFSPESFAETAFVFYDQYGIALDVTELMAYGEILLDWTDESSGDWDIMMETELWWFSVIKSDGTVWATRYIPIEDIF